MAATNFTPIQLYHSTTAAAVPVNTNLVNGELAINITDGKLYYKDNGGTVQVIATKATGTIGGSDTQVQYNSSGALAGSSNFTFNGTTATINTLNLTNALGATYGGTAQSSWTTGDLLYASGSNTLAKLGIGLSTYILTSNGTIPGWSAPSAVSIGTATNLAGGAAGSVPYQSGAGVTTFLSIGTANQVITSSGSAPQWSSGLSITTLTASDAVTFSATTQNIALGTSQTSGTFTVGGAAQTGTQTVDQSTKTHTLNIGTGATESGATKTVNLATAGVSGSTTTMSVGSAVSGAITNLTVNATTTLAPVARSTGAVSYFTVTTPADTGLTASTEVIGSSFTAATRTWATGALTLQRERVFAAPTYAFAGASTLTTAVNVDIGLPVAGTNATITNAYALRADNTLFTGNVVLNNASAALDLTNLEVTNIKAKDGTASMTLADSTGVVTFSKATVIEATDNTNAALRITQLGTGNALLVEDSANPDSSPFVVTATGDVGIGTSSPAYKLVSAVARGSVGWALYNTNAASYDGWLASTSDNGLAINARGQTAGNATGNTLYLQTGDTTRATLDSSGNLGLGVTPSAWGSTYRALQVGLTASLVGLTNDTRTHLSTNARFDGTNWLYIATSPASRYAQIDNQHQWYNAPSGTANTASVTSGASYTVVALGSSTLAQWQAFFNDSSNNPLTVTPTLGQVLTGNATGTLLGGGLVTQNISFTQAMTLDASGRLGVGETNPAYKLDVAGAIRTTAGTISTSSVTTVQIAGGGSIYGTFYIRATGANIDHKIEVAVAAQQYNQAYVTVINNDPYAGTSVLSNPRVVGTVAGDYRYLVVDTTTTTALSITAGAIGQVPSLSLSATPGGSTAVTNYLNVLNSPSGTVFNETSIDVDFRVEGDTDTHLIFADASTDRVGIGTNNPGYKFDVNGNFGLGTGQTGNVGVFGANTATADTYFRLRNTAGTFDIGTAAGGHYLYGAGSLPLQFFTSTIEHARITSGGYFKASDNGTYLNSTGTYHEINQTANDNILFIRSTDTAYSVDGVQLRFSRNTTNNSFYVLSYYNATAAAYKFRVADSGDVTNTNGTYGTISDAKMKTDIVDAGSQWSDIKALRFRKFKMKNDPSGLVQLGVVAQEVELTSPGLVDEHADKDAEGNDLGTTTKSVKTSVLLMKAAVALQEAMARIEKLEAEVAALKGA